MLIIGRTLLTCIIAALSLSMVQSARSQVEISTATFDFGTVFQNSTVRHGVWIKASATDTIRIADIKTGCGCLASQIEVDEIAPGDSLRIVLYWQTRGSLNRTSKSAFIYYTDPALEPTEIILTGNVVTSFDSIASITWTPEEITFSTGKRDQELRQTFSVINRTGSDLAMSIVSSGPEINIQFPDSVAVGKTASGSVTISTEYQLEDFENSFTLELTGNQEPPFRVSIPVVFGDFSFRPTFTTNIE